MTEVSFVENLETTDRSIGITLSTGALVCLIFALLFVAVNGPVLDESVMPAQIISGAVTYPRGHPHDVFYKSAYSITNFLMAGLYAIRPDPWFLSAIRNVWFLFLTVFVPLSATTIMTGHCVWGYLAAVLTLLGGTGQFQSAYPIFTLPNYYSNGHIGIHLAVLAVVLIVGGFWRTGGLLMGLMPSIHASTSLVALCWCASYVGRSRGKWTPRVKRRFVVSMCIGIAVSTALAVMIGIYSAAPLVYSSVYNNSGQAEDIYRQFTATSDVHRRVLLPLCVGTTVNPIAFFCSIGLIIWNQPTGRPPEGGLVSVRCKHVGVIGVIAWSVLLGAWAWHSAFGRLPVIVQIVMPGRLSNFTSMLLVPLTITALASIFSLLNQKTRILALILLLSLVLLALARPSGRSLSIAWGLMFASALQARPERGYRLAVAGMSVIYCAAMLIASDPRDLALMLTAFGGSLLVFQTKNFLRMLAEQLKWYETRWSIVLLCCCGLLTARVLYRARAGGGGEGRFDPDIPRCLTANSRPTDMILVSPYPSIEQNDIFSVAVGIQATTGHPVLMELETLWLMSYMPRLAPVIGRMSRDLFSIDYSNETQRAEQECLGFDGDHCPSVFPAWTKRDQVEWETVSAKYNFSLVLAPAKTVINLPLVCPSNVFDLYKIPSSTPARIVAVH